MRTFKSFILSLFVITIAQVSFAQAKQETFKVAGECGMCKTKIEKAAKSAGATYAVWNTESKDLVVKYDAKKADAAKIQQSIAAVGYDTPNYKATDEAYNKLHECCKYERAVAGDNAVKCCDNADCCKDGKCANGAECSKDMKCCKSGDKACCADGKCTKDGKHDDHAAPTKQGASCCKKS